jgi:hypothetical protein
VIDTSASVAILFGEPEAATFAEILEQDLVRLISAASVLEAAIVVESEFGHRGARERDHLLYQAGSRVPFSPEHLARGPPCLSGLRQVSASRRPELRRLRQLGAQQEHRRAAPAQGRELPAHRRRAMSRALNTRPVAPPSGRRSRSSHGGGGAVAAHS